MYVETESNRERVSEREEELRKGSSSNNNNNTKFIRRGCIKGRQAVAQYKIRFISVEKFHIIYICTTYKHIYM